MPDSNTALCERKKPRAKKLLTIIPTLVQDGDFKPTALMIQFMVTYLQVLTKDPHITPYECIKHSRLCSVQSLYDWQKKPGFEAWLNKCHTEYFSTTGLTKVHKRVYETALDNSSADRKLYLERFDPGYKPQSGQTLSLTGYVPPETPLIAQNDSESMRKRLECIDRGSVELPSKVIENSLKSSTKDDNRISATAAESPQ
jgi:hypothetical protein